MSNITGGKGRAEYLQGEIAQAIIRADQILEVSQLRYVFGKLLEDPAIKSKLVNANSDKH